MRCLHIKKNKVLNLKLHVLHLLGDGLLRGQRVLLLGVCRLEVGLVKLGEGGQAGVTRLLHLGHQCNWEMASV